MIDLQNATDARLSYRISWRKVLCISAVLMAAWPLGAQAQINPFRGYKGPTLSKEDFAAGRAAADKLLTEDHAEVGKSEEWIGPTGNQGSISVQKAFKRQGRECRTMRSEVRYKKSDHPRTLELNVCRLTSGEWKLI